MMYTLDELISTAEKNNVSELKKMVEFIRYKTEPEWNEYEYKWFDGYDVIGNYDSIVYDRYRNGIVSEDVYTRLSEAFSKWL